MNVFCLVCFLSAFCLVIVPGPSAGSPPREAPVSMSSSDESGAMAEALKLPEPSTEANPSELSHPDEPLFSANQEDEPAQVTDENTSSTSYEKGVEILSCGTCIDFYGLNERLKVGIISNTHNIAQSLIDADRLIRA